MVLAVICDTTGHVPAEDVLERVHKRYPYLNKSAVYRTLELLSQLGFITQTDFGQGRIEYELHRHPHHHHLVCRKCGKLTQVDETLFLPLAKSLAKDYGFAADLDHFAIYGTCSRCQEQKKPDHVAVSH